MAESAPVRAYVSVGANIAPELNIPAGLRRLSARLTVVGVSSFYRTPAIDRPEQADYLNGVIALETDLPPRLLRETLRQVEELSGRVRGEDAYAARPLDLDILLYENAIISENDLTIPDPDILSRPFLAAGLLDLDPTISIPGTGRGLAELTDPGVLAALKKEDAFTRKLKENLFHEP